MNENQLNKTAYMGDTEDGYSKYVLYLDGRETMFIYTSKNEQGHPIYLSKPFEDDRIKTQWFASMTSDGTRISSMSIKQAVYMNMPWMLADIYVPKN